MKRRLFLGAAAAAASACGRRTAPALRIFSEDEAQTLNAWLDCLIPADDLPGAVDAGVIHYIDRQLTKRFRKQRPDYTRALAAIQRMAKQETGERFAALDFDQRTVLLEKFETQENALFEMVLNHAMQGFYGNPRHGGNKDYVSWRMLGVPPAPVRGRMHYTAQGDRG